MDAFGLVSCDPPWKWVVEKPVFVTWNHKEEGPSSLGQLSPLNSISRLTLNIGWRYETNELLIALHLPVSIRSSRRPRDMFMVVASNFGTTHLDLSFAPVQAEGQSALKSAGLSEGNLFHVPFKLSKTCDVVMPQAKREKPVKGTPKELISKFKSLSETLSFDTYFRFDTYAQVELREIFTRLSQLTTPPLMLESMYDGRGGGINLWLNQGLGMISVGASELDNSICCKEKNCGRHTETRRDCPPPPYLAHAIPPPDMNGPAQVQVPFSDASDSSTRVTTDTDIIPETPRENEHWTRIRELLEYRSPGYQSPSMRGALKRAANISSLSEEENAHRSKQPRPYQSPPVGPSLCETLIPSAVIDEHLDHSSPYELATSHPPLPSSLLPVDDMTEEIALWLYNAWVIMPRTHYYLRVELLALGAAVDRTAFAGARIECSTRLAFVVARVQKQDPGVAGVVGSMMTLPDAEEQVREVVQWINGVKSDGDLLVLQELVVLADRAMDVVNAGPNTRSDKEKAFLLCKARCIASTCRRVPSVATTQR